jgi:hypothetical protein
LKDTEKDYEGPAEARALFEELPCQCEPIDEGLLPSARDLIAPIKFKYGGLSSDFKFHSSVGQYRWTDSVPKPWAVKFTRTDFVRAVDQWRSIDFGGIDPWALGTESWDPTETYGEFMAVPPPPCLW